MSWDIDVREKVYQRLANEVFFRILHGKYDPISCIIPHFLRKNNSPRCVTKRFLLLRIIPHNSHTHHEYGRLYL